MDYYLVIYKGEVAVVFEVPSWCEYADPVEATEKLEKFDEILNEASENVVLRVSEKKLNDLTISDISKMYYCLEKLVRNAIETDKMICYAGLLLSMRNDINYDIVSEVQIDDFIKRFKTVVNFSRTPLEEEGVNVIEP